MSEYQYHEWQTVDRVLTPDEQAAVNNLSSHIEVSSSRAVVTYHWSDFKHDPKQVLLKYFDAYFYLANWGSLRLMFRFPKGLLEEPDLLPYCVDETITFETTGQHQVLDIDFNPEGSGGWMEADAGLAFFINLRADLLAGDHRLLYLAWLKAMTDSGGEYDENWNDLDFLGGEFDDEWNESDISGDEYVEEPDDSGILGSRQEPLVPPGLKKLTPSLQNFIQVFEIDPFLVQAAAEASPDPKKAAQVDYHELIRRLPREECDELLRRLAEGDPGAGLALRKRLGAFLPQEPAQPAGQRTVQELLQRAEQLKLAEQQRQAEAARQKHIAEMRDLARREGQVWQQVNDIIDDGRKIASVYDHATGLLDRLKQLSEFQDTGDIFQARMQQLAQKYSSRPSLIDRWRRRGWV
jgi:hypothetical protein